MAASAQHAYSPDLILPARLRRTWMVGPSPNNSNSNSNNNHKKNIKNTNSETTGANC